MPISLRVADQEISRGRIELERQGRSKTQREPYRSSARHADRELPRPNRTPSEHNRLAAAEGASVSQSQSVPQKPHGSDPKTAALFGLKSGPTCFHLVAASPSSRSAPKQRVPVSFDPLFFLVVALLRRPPAGKSVTSGTRAEPAVVRRRLRQKHSRTR